MGMRLHSWAPWGRGHVQPSAWEVDFDCWECSHMPKLILGALLCGQNVFGTDKLERMCMRWHRGHRGAVAHVQPSAWGVGFDCWECSHMPKVIFGSLIVRVKCVWHGQVGTHGHVVALVGTVGLWHMFNQVHGKLILIVGNALICQK
ncbi:hypothetical protein FNV43_RR20617 [Rhamnella rubrinervis]|uniref:Uncharacterized protein n=1 Tax=Rhamnella rubrinervis TaxID=2594499 RepID=A0A8K0GUC4_9ROSA|nr:hypothetical protein FNV43_RR20617 [Rhamnella rubrinervis]